MFKFMFPRVNAVFVSSVMVCFCGLMFELLQETWADTPVQAEKKRDISNDFYVDLPREKKPFPHPLSPEHSEPGFKIRGIKGWNWTAEQYLAEIPVMAEYKMNFLMNCYLSFYSPSEQKGGYRTLNFDDPDFDNQWWKPLPVNLKKDYEKVIRSCQKHGIEFCFSMHPQLFSSRPIDPTSEKDFKDLWKHYEWAQNLGVKWFSLQLDDVHIIDVKIDGGQHSLLANKLFKRLRRNDPECRFVFCPAYYWGDGSDTAYQTYFKAISENLHPDIYLFWSGDAGPGSYISSEGALSYKNKVKHRIIFWDNYPVNDNHPTMHLGPLNKRDSDLCEIVDGYMSNPMCKQNQINRISMLTCADYAYNPYDYDPARSVGQAIVHLEQDEKKQHLLANLVEAYTGMIAFEKGVGFNAVRYRYNEIKNIPHSSFVVKQYLQYFINLADEMGVAFPDKYTPAQQTLQNDINWMKTRDKK